MTSRQLNKQIYGIHSDQLLTQYWIVEIQTIEMNKYGIEAE